MEFIGLGLKANSSLVLLSFLRGWVRLKSILKLLADSRKLWGLGGDPEVKKGWNRWVWASRLLLQLVFFFLRGLVRLRLHWTCSRTPGSCGGLGRTQRSKKCGIDGSGPQGNCSSWFFVILRGLFRLKSILKLLADSQDLWGFGEDPELKKEWN